MKMDKEKKSGLRGKNILIVNAGSSKKRFILQKIKKTGARVTCVNKEKSSWAIPYVDDWIITDTSSHTETLQAVGAYIKDKKTPHLDGAFTYWEDDVLLTSKITDRFGFIGIPYHVAKQARNKFLFRDFCKINNLPTIGHKIINSSKDLDDLGHLKFPLVIKPVYGSSSAFVIKVDNKEELHNSYQFIQRAISTSVESALADGTELLVEEYIDGDEVDVDIVIQNSRMKFYGVSDNTKTKEPFFIEDERYTPSGLPDTVQKNLVRMCDVVLEKLGVQNGVIHFEAKATSEGVMPIEVNLRMGGDEIYSSIKDAWKVDLIESAIKIACGQYIPYVNLDREPYKYLIAKTLVTDYSGIIVKLNVDEELEKKEYLEEFELYKKVGDEIMAPPNGYEYLGWIMVSGENFLDAEDNLEDTNKYLEYEVAKFHSMSSIGKMSRNGDKSANGSNYFLRSKKIEKIRQMSIEHQRKLHIGIACNQYNGSNNSGSVEEELASVGRTIEKTLKERGYKTTFFDFNNVQKLFENLKNSDVDMVFNLCERINNSSLLEPHAASLLDVLEIPYTGSNPSTLSLCIDKIRVKKLLNYHKIPTPKWDYVYDLKDPIREDLHYPLIVKPANTDNSIGISNDSVVINKDALTKQVKKVMTELSCPVLIEEYIEGDEYDVSIIGSEEDDLQVLPLSRSIFDNMPKGYWHIYPYDAKYKNAQLYLKNIIVQRPAKNISTKLKSLLGEIALDTYNILDCHDYGRIEIRVDENNNPYVLELNPNPSINKGNCVPAVAEVMGMDYGDFLEEIIRLAIKRYKNKPPYYHLQTNVM